MAPTWIPTIHRVGLGEVECPYALLGLAIRSGFLPLVPSGSLPISCCFVLHRSSVRFVPFKWQ